MATTMHDGERRGLTARLLCSRYTLPVFSVAMGLVMFGLFLHAGDWAGGVWSLGIMTAFAGVVLFGGRSETIRGLRGDGRDERFAMIDLRATAIAGLVVIIAIIGGFMVEISQGHSGAPYAQLGAIAGLAYIGAIAVLRLRS